MSSRGQIVIPEGIRRRLGLKAGMQFVVVGERDVVVLKALAPPSMTEFDELISQARHQARAAGMKRSAVPRAVRQARRIR
jgi:AbrB family looped-hinge helix DNA binding protein